MGIIGAAFGLGLVFGPVIGGYFGGGDINNIDYKTPFFFAFVVATISFLLAYFILIEPKKRNFLLKNVWNYSSKSDTHTVETHIHRLRKKILEKFGDNNFIKNNNKGYYI